MSNLEEAKQYLHAWAMIVTCCDIHNRYRGIRGYDQMGFDIDKAMEALTDECSPSMAVSFCADILVTYENGGYRARDAEK